MTIESKVFIKDLLFLTVLVVLVCWFKNIFKMIILRLVLCNQLTCYMIII